MKKNRQRLKTTAVFLAWLILLQGCVVYHKTPTTLEQAAQEYSTTKVTTSDNETIKYKYITHDKGTYYGVTTRYGKEIMNPLNEEEITKILTKDKKASTWTTVLVIGVPVLTFVILGFAIGGGLEGGQNFIPK